MKYTRYEQSTSSGVNFLIIIFISYTSIASLFMYLIILLIHF